MSYSKELQFDELEKARVHNSTSVLTLRKNVRFALSRFRSLLLTASRLISFPAVTKMLQFSAFNFLSECPEGQDFPFRNLGIKGCLRLPQAYRSLPRPSSALEPKRPPSSVTGLNFCRW